MEQLIVGAAAGGVGLLAIIAAIVGWLMAPRKRTTEVLTQDIQPVLDKQKAEADARAEREEQRVQDALDAPNPHEAVTNLWKNDPPGSA